MKIIRSQVKLRLTNKSKSAIIKEMESLSLSSPIPGIIWSKWSDDHEYQWHIGFYEKDEIQEGWLFDASGIEFYTYQDFIFEKLDGGILDMVDGEIVIQPA